MIRYFKAYPGGSSMEDQFRNGSFLRTGAAGRGKVAVFMNGDYMGADPGTPKSLTAAGHEEVPKKVAEQLIPRCCGGIG